MSLLAELVAEEWLNRRGYFTIRGVKLGNDEIDILAIRPLSNGNIERRHIEVSVSTNPIGYFSPLPKSVRKATGRALRGSGACVCYPAICRAASTTRRINAVSRLTTTSASPLEI